MAIYHLNLKTFGRSDGSSAPGAAAYRAGERIRDERTGRTHDHSARQDVMHKEIVLPARFADADMDWARDRASLWNAAEAAETRKNARVAREYLVALPRELTPDQRLGLVRGFAQELSDRYRFAVDVAIHAPRDFPGSDPRNFHAHLLATTREVSLEGLAAKTALELSDAARQKLGLAPAVNELFHVRERWATVTNQALEKANVESRIDHRTLAAQGIDREPTPWIPRAALEAERRGYRSEVAERIRSDYQARVQARQQSAAEGRRPPPPAAAAAVTAQTPVAAQPPIDAQPAAAQPAAAQPAPPQSLEEIRRQARDNWLRLRQQAAVQTAPQAAREATHQPNPSTQNAAPSAEHRARDDDLSR